MTPSAAQRRCKIGRATLAADGGRWRRGEGRAISLRLGWAAAAALVLASCTRGDTVASSSSVVRFAIVAPNGGSTDTTAWKRILADVEAQTGLRVRPRFASNGAVVVEAMAKGNADAGWFSDVSGLEAVRKAGGEVFARSVGPNGLDGDTSVLVTADKRPLTLDRALRCDRTLTIGMGDAQSAFGTLAPVAYLFAPRSIDPKTCFRDVRSAPASENLAAAVRGQIDLATVSSANLAAGQTVDGRPVAGAVRIIWRSPLLPRAPLVWRRTLDPVVKEKLRQFFLTYGQGDGPEASRQRAILARIAVGGFLPADDSNLLPVQEMEAGERLLEARRSRDPARISQARADLAAITARRLALEARTRAPAAAQ